MVHWLYIVKTFFFPFWPIGFSFYCCLRRSSPCCRCFTGNIQNILKYILIHRPCIVMCLSSKHFVMIQYLVGFWSLNVSVLQGVEAQTLANVYLAMENNLEIIPVSLLPLCNSVWLESSCLNFETENYSIYQVDQWLSYPFSKELKWSSKVSLSLFIIILFLLLAFLDCDGSLLPFQLISLSVLQQFLLSRELNVTIAVFPLLAFGIENKWFPWVARYINRSRLLMLIIISFVNTQILDWDAVKYVQSFMILAVARPANCKFLVCRFWTKSIFLVPTQIKSAKKLKRFQLTQQWAWKFSFSIIFPTYAVCIVAYVSRNECITSLPVLDLVYIRATLQLIMIFL